MYLSDLFFNRFFYIYSITKSNIYEEINLENILSWKYMKLPIKQQLDRVIDDLSLHCNSGDISRKLRLHFFLSI